MEDRQSVSLVLICPAHEIKTLEKIFLDNDYFSFDSEKVCAKHLKKYLLWSWDFLEID